VIRTLFHALRTGASVPNPTPLKWAGVAVAVALIALEVAKSYGVLADVQESAIIELVMAGLVLYSQIASTDKIGILPANRRDHDPERMQSESVPTRADAPEARNSTGFPDGPFFGS
jgi:hypothetical protein